MIVPQFWAEGRSRHRDKDRQVTVRRFGWSDVSQEDAQSNADKRAQEALARFVAGEKLDRRERKTAYNGAAGVPIREEIVSRHGDIVVTRNGYGARCLNTPDVLFADIDFEEAPALWLGLVSFVVFMSAAIAIWSMFGVWYGIGAVVFGLFAFHPSASATYRLVLKARGGAESIALRRVMTFVAGHPEWNLRLYRTPAGLRVLVTHRTFKPDEPAVAGCFGALKVDPLYARMCRNQQCFRARVSPKPWRIGLGDRLKPRPGVWPINPSRMPERIRWIDAYEKAAENYSACRFMNEFGSKSIDPRARDVQVLHDQLSRALSELPSA